MQITEDESFTKIVESHIVDIYKGTIFHWQEEKESDSFKEKLPVIKATREGVYNLAVKQYEQSKELFETDRTDILIWINDYVVDTGKYRNFNLIEPLEEI